MIIKSSYLRIALLTALGLAAHLLLTASLEAAALKDFRLGVGREKTRIVFEMDGPVSYQVLVSDSGLTVRLERLTSTQGLLGEVLQGQGGLLKRVRSESGAEGLTFHLITAKGPHFSHFSLKNPDRVVVDLLPGIAAIQKTPSPVAAQTTDKKSAKTTVSPPVEKPPEVVATKAQQVEAVSDTLAQPPKSETPAEPQAQTEELTQEALPATGTNYLFYAIPFIILAAGGILLYMMARRSNRRIYDEDVQEEEVSEILEERIDFRSLMKRKAASQKEAVEAESIPADQPESEDKAAGDATIAPPQEPSSAAMTETSRVTTPKGETREDSRAELSIENARLIWPVHLLDGGRIGRVMVVDDDPGITQMMEDYLVGAGYEVQAQADSRKALEMYPEWRPDLLILDVKMPGLDGIDFAKAIREQGNHQKILFLSGQAERDSVAAVFEAELLDGQYEFMRKPISLQQIGGRVRDFFSSAQEILQLNLNSDDDFAEQIGHLGPHQLVALHGFVWDHIFEISAELLGRRIEAVYITDRMEPASNYMRRMGCQERRDYCIASKCIVSNPSCAANRLRAELEIMRQILMEFRAGSGAASGRKIYACPPGGASASRARPRRRN
jgi:CheY-like chemotaxis protein